MNDLLTRLYGQYFGKDASASPSKGGASSSSSTGVDGASLGTASQQIKDEMIVARKAVSVSLKHGAEENSGVVQAQSLDAAFPEEVLCGDTLGDDLIVGTATGIYHVDVQSKRVRKTVDGHRFVHLSVLEGSDLVLALGSTEGKQGKLYAFTLKDVTGASGGVISGRLADHKVEKTKGCHTFCLSQGAPTVEMPPKVCIAVKNLLLVFVVGPPTAKGDAVGRLLKWKV